MTASPSPALSVRNLSVVYRTGAGDARAVDAVSFEVAAGEALGIVGESGCGKSTIVKAILGILPEGTLVTGEIVHEGANLVTLALAELNRIRGRRIALVPQSAMHALDPVYTVRRQIAEVIEAHEPGRSRAEIDKRIAALFRMVGISEGRADDYPHQLSGGQRQRVMIAMALALDPAIVVADEPTTGLDVIVQDQIMARFKEIQRELGKAMLLITHDIALVAESCDRVLVMYAGRVAEIGPASLLDAPIHPYTIGLMAAFPDIDDRARDLITIPKSPPSLLAPPRGCRFHERCPFALARCREEEPTLAEIEPGRYAACHRAGDAPAMRTEAARPETWRRVEA